MEMEKIKSFLIDHDDHPIGFYFSSENEDIYTYDLRFKLPNGGDYLSVSAMHTVEHLFATAIRNSAVKKDVIYFGPMGCRTGFYLLLRGIEPEKAKALTLNAFKVCLTMDSIPGSKKKECGNYKSHNLAKAKEEISAYIKILESK